LPALPCSAVVGDGEEELLPKTAFVELGTRS
jgi:hypothetical protein